MTLAYMTSPTDPNGAGGDFSSPFDVFSGGGGQAIAGSSSGDTTLGTSDIVSQLLGTAGSAYNATVNADAATQIAQAQAAQQAAYVGGFAQPLAVLNTSSGRQWLIIGAGILALALILRK